MIVEAISAAAGIGSKAPSEFRHPRKFLVSAQGRRFDSWVYAWTLTPGGRPTLSNEYRIQMTTVTSPLEANPRGPTVIIGYEPNLEVFAGFDTTRHSVFTEGSPSVQISIETLHQALQTGLAFELKANQEIAIGIRPDHFLFYCEHTQDLHSLGADSAALSVMSRVARLQDIPDADVESLRTERQRIVEEASRWTRSASFRVQVLQAYEHRCAVTRWQMRLVDAAHIFPVAAGPESVDDVRNGIALSPTFHRAFDQGLIYLDDEFTMRLNERRADQLKQLQLGDGLVGLEAILGKIHLPFDNRQWPDRYFIRLANEYRRIG